MTPIQAAAEGLDLDLQFFRLLVCLHLTAGQGNTHSLAKMLLPPTVLLSALIGNDSVASQQANIFTSSVVQGSFIWRYKDLNLGPSVYKALVVRTEPVLRGKSICLGAQF